ncbi:DMT family transporter [Ammoniphilus sp. YIM 78166]|uniref:DMT family transporter n=1 Tax=Ammoniphilus sp. YIM 78166 TaxID=1644106 RepID=UPI00106FCC03|nr:DMT family transporter [Ammoniphilus sp. YIM 78166]
MNKSWAWTLLTLCNLFWAGNYIVGKLIVVSISPFWITLIRWGIALIFLVPLAYFFERPRWSLIRRYWLPLSLMGGLGVVGFTLICYVALEYTSPTNAAFVEALIPAVVVIFSFFLLYERISYLQIAGFFLSCLGVVILLTKGSLDQIILMSFNKGDLLMLVAVLAWAFYSIIGKKVDLPPITATAASSFFGMLMLLPFALFIEASLPEWSVWTVSGMLYMSLFASVASYLFWNMSVRVIGASQASVFLNLVPIFTIMLSLALGDTITLSQIGGGLIVLVGVYLTTGLLDQVIASRVKPKEVQIK